MHSTCRRRLTLLSATFLTGALATAPALAQPADATAPAAPIETAQAPTSAAAAAGADSGEIVVTATRRAASLQDVPINISAMSGDMLAQQRVDDIRDIADFTPGITVSDTGPRSTGTVVLRGLNASDSDDLGAGYDDALGIYLGEVPLYYDFKLLDIARVETLLGPQGTLYGLGTLAGAIRYIPKRPDADDYQAEVHGRVYIKDHSNDVGTQVDGVINIPLVTDHIALRSTFGYYFDPGFFDSPLLIQQPVVSIPQPGGADVNFTDAAYNANLRRQKDINFEKTITSRNQLLLQLNPDVKAIVTYGYQQTKTDGRQSNSAGVLGTGRYEIASRYLEPAKRRAHLVSFELNANLWDFADLVSTTAYTDVLSRSQFDVTDLLLDLDYDYEAFPSFSGFSETRDKRTQVNQEVRLVSRHGGPLNWVLGGFYNEQKRDQFYFESTPGLSNVFGVTGNPDDLEYVSFIKSKIVEKAVFGEATFNVTDAFQVTGGLRYFDYTSEIQGALVLPLLGDPISPFDPSIRPAGGKGGQDGFVWKLNTSYKMSRDFMVYATYSKGYRLGGPNRVAPCPDPLPLGQQNACALPNEQQYGPDKTKNIELGVRAQLIDRKLTINANIFHIKWNGIQVDSATLYGATGITVNGGTARSKGFEASVNARPVPELVINGTYSYTDAELTSAVPGLITVRRVPGDYDVRPKFLQLDALSGDRLPGSARHAASLGTTYTYALASGELITNWTAVYRGSIVSRLGGTRTFGELIPDYMTHRASVTYSTERFDLSLWANNIFDKYAVTSIGNDRSRIGVNDGIAVRYYNRAVLNPRTLGVEGRFRF
ncbi:MAG: TonB-dependent receptor [Sphingomonas bacterium]|nr:TonB-dependent receptor [Sphingomonas bacterium]